MADSKITSLTADTTPAGADIATTVQSPFASGSNRKVTLDNLVNPVIIAIDDTDSPYTANDSERSIMCDCTSGAITVNLPALSGITNRIYVIKKIDNSINAVTIDGSGSETIDGITTNTISSQYNSITLQAGASEWHLI